MSEFHPLLKALALCVVFALVCNGAAPVQATNVLVLLDLTQSTPENVYNAYLEHITKLLAKAPVGSMAVYGITESSFAHPEQIAGKRLPEAVPPFETELKKARASLLTSWKTASQHLVRNRSMTDVLGAVMYASIVLQKNHHGKKVLVIFSDMRHCTRELDVENVAEIRADALKKVKAAGMIADLKGISVWVIGAHTSGKDPRYYSSLEKFWTSYFSDAGSDLQRFSPETDFDSAEIFNANKNAQVVTRQPGRVLKHDR